MEASNYLNCFLLFYILLFLAIVVILFLFYIIFFTFKQKPLETGSKSHEACVFSNTNSSYLFKISHIQLTRKIFQCTEKMQSTHGSQSAMEGEQTKKRNS